MQMTDRKIAKFQLHNHHHQHSDPHFYRMDDLPVTPTTVIKHWGDDLSKAEESNIYRLQLPWRDSSTKGRSDLAVACPTALREVLGLNLAVGSCVYCKNHCNLQPWARAVRTFPAVPRST